MNPIAEALDIVEKWMLSKNRPAGCGRLHRLLTNVQRDYFLDDPDDAVELPTAALVNQDAPF